jgi:hypothetical protein
MRYRGARAARRRASESGATGRHPSCGASHPRPIRRDRAASAAPASRSPPRIRDRSPMSGHRVRRRARRDCATTISRWRRACGRAGCAGNSPTAVHRARPRRDDHVAGCWAGRAAHCADVLMPVATPVELWSLRRKAFDRPVVGIVPGVIDMFGFATVDRPSAASRIRSPLFRKSQREPSSATKWQRSMYCGRCRSIGSLHGPSIESAHMT